MGMTEQRDYMRQLLNTAESKVFSKEQRTEAWIEWGLNQRDTHHMGKALRAISDLMKSK